MTRKPGDVLRAALTYAERGWYVFPLGPHSKKPLAGSRGLLDATTDPEKIRNWFRDHPDLNIAVACGPSGLVVVDIDVAKGAKGKESFDRWVGDHGPFPRTPEQITGGGGRQIFMSVPEGVKVPTRAPWRKDYPGIDVRADGGYCAMPPSIHPDTGAEYAWSRGALPSDIDVAPLNDSAFSFVDSAIDGNRQQVDRSVDESGHAGRQEFPDVINDGEGRERTLVAFAGQLRRSGLDDDEILAALEAFNDKRIVPPKSDHDLRRIARSVARYQPDPTEAMRMRYERKHGPLQGPETADTDDDGVVGGIDQLIEPWAVWAARADENVPSLIPGILHAGSLAALASAPKTGKTWLADEIMLCISSGKPFMNRIEPEQTGDVLYIGTEGVHADSRDRLKAMAQGKGCVDTLDRISFLWKRGLMLDSDDDGLMLYLQSNGGRWALIVIDVLADAWSGNENASDEFRRMLNGLRKVTATGATVLVLHHNVKPSQENAGRREGFNMRGSGALYGAIDDGIYLVPTEDRCRSKVALETRAGAPYQPERWEFSWPEYTVTGEDSVTLTWLAGQEAVDETTALQKRIGEWLSRHPSSQLGDVASGLGIKGDDKREVSKALKALVAAGVADYEQASMEGKNGSPVLRNLYSMKPDLESI